MLSSIRWSKEVTAERRKKTIHLLVMKEWGLLPPDAGRRRIRTEDLWACSGEQQKRISSIIQSHPSNDHQRQRPWVIFKPDKLLKGVSVPKPLQSDLFDSNLQPSDQKSGVKMAVVTSCSGGEVNQKNQAWLGLTGRHEQVDRSEAPAHVSETRKKEELQVSDTFERLLWWLCNCLQWGIGF